MFAELEEEDWEEDWEEDCDMGWELASDWEEEGSRVISETLEVPLVPMAERQSTK